MDPWLREQVKVRRPVTQIYNGIDTERFAPHGPVASLRQELGLRSSTLVIAAVGRLDPIKDHAGLIQTFAQVRQAYPDCALVIVGDGPEHERLAAMQAPGVFLLGARYDIPEILRAVDVFALASINEGISNTILEAMATGLPVVSTNVGGTPELITHGDNGFLAKPGCIEELASHLLAYLQDPGLRKEHGLQNRKVTNERFSIQAMVQGYEQVWRRVAGKR
jgi:glycosyltransferase involved in cell wall biosynthesis